MTEKKKQSRVVEPASAWERAVDAKSTTDISRPVENDTGAADTSTSSTPEADSPPMDGPPKSTAKDEEQRATRLMFALLLLAVGVIAGIAVEKSYGGGATDEASEGETYEDGHRAGVGDARSAVERACRYGQYCDDNEEEEECGAGYVCRELFGRWG